MLEPAVCPAVVMEVELPTIEAALRAEARPQAGEPGACRVVQARPAVKKVAPSGMDRPALDRTEWQGLGLCRPCRLRPAGLMGESLRL